MTRRRWPLAVRFLGVVVFVTAASLVAVAALTGLSPSALLGLVSAGSAASKPTARPPPAAPARQSVPLYSDGWLDDSGMAIATDFEAPVTDPASLVQVGAARTGRAARGIA